MQSHNATLLLNEILRSECHPSQQQTFPVFSLRFRPSCCPHETPSKGREESIFRFAPVTLCLMVISINKSANIRATFVGLRSDESVFTPS